MLKLEARPQASKFWGIASPLLALAITVIIGIGIFLLMGKDPVKGLTVFFWEPIKSAYALSELAVKATPLLLIALGLAVCYRANVWNIGAEGQSARLLLVAWRCWRTSQPGRGSSRWWCWRACWVACCGLRW